MSFTGENSKKITIAAGGTVFPYDFLIYSSAHLGVYVDGVLQATGYTVDGVGEAAGGNVTFDVAPDVNAVITCNLEPPFTQELEYTSVTKFPAASHEKGLDLNVQLCKRLAEVDRRSLKFPIDALDAEDPTLPDATMRKGHFLYFDATTGNPTIADELEGNIAVTGFAQTILDDTDAASVRATIGVVPATETVQGIVELATQAEVNSGIDTTRVVTPATLAAALAALQGFSTGDIKPAFKTVADTGWVLLDDKTIGSAASAATGRANADTEALYTLLWNNIIDQWCPVSTGRGASAAADFAANKVLTLPRFLGRVPAQAGTGVVSISGVDGGVDIGANTFTVPINANTWVTGMPVVFTLSSGTITGLTSGNTYYIHRQSSTLIRLATTLANAQNAVLIDFTAKSSPVWTVTHTYTATVLGETGGEQIHAISLLEMPAHSGHTGGATAAGGGGAPISSNTKGGNVAMNLIQPTVYINYMVKL